MKKKVDRVHYNWNLESGSLNERMVRATRFAAVASKQNPNASACSAPARLCHVLLPHYVTILVSACSLASKYSCLFIAQRHPPTNAMALNVTQKTCRAVGRGDARAVPVTRVSKPTVAPRGVNTRQVSDEGDSRDSLP